MKNIVSVSLGSSARDHTVKAHFAGEEFTITRRGTDGDMRQAMSLLQELDGTVDAIGLGGVDVYLFSRSNRYTLRDGQKLLDCVQQTPTVDGSGLKNTLERRCIRELAATKAVPIDNQKVLMVSGMDRFGMAEALEEAGGRCVYGDLIFTLGVDKPILSLEELDERAEKLLPELSKLPISMLYPTGKSQQEHDECPIATPYLEDADIIAGDFHLIRAKLPQGQGRLAGKTIITNTTTASDVDLLRILGVQNLITTTPELDGRSFGTNVMEAVIVSLIGKSPEDCKEEDYLKYIEKAKLKPELRVLGK